MARLKALDARDYITVARDQAEVGPRQQVHVAASGESGFDIPGTKCAHSVYIPYSSPDANRSEFCSLCYPYILQEVEDGQKTGLVQSFRVTLSEAAA